MDLPRNQSKNVLQYGDRLLQHALVLVNPCRNKDNLEALRKAVQLLESADFDVSLCEPESESHMNTLIKDFRQEKGVVIIAGGDGTISSAVETVYSCQHTLAIFPLGTANDFARTLGVPLNLLEAAQVVVDGKRKRASLGKVNDHFFINVSHLGLGVDVTHALSPRSKMYFGVFSYLGSFIRAVNHKGSFKVHIEANGWRYSTRAIHLAIGNGRFYGGGNIVEQNATLFDGTLNLFCIKAQRWWELLLLGRKLRHGQFQKVERIVSRSAETFSVRTSKPRELVSDGEVKTKTPAEFTIIPSAIEVIVGDVPMPTEENQ
jgi:YegS/Rv2252/BmrU family lipid kinase